VEVLIVVALIAILAVIALVTINPFEAQKRTRDARRLKEIGTAQGIIEQYIADNPNAAGITSESTDNSASNSCTTAGWLGVDICNYANTLAADPLNRSAEYTLTDGSSTTGAMYYQILIDANLRYRICTRLESAANASKLTEDGVANNFFEVYSSTNSPTCT
jgi:type II secretory pathway pseudopilin PulG